MNSSTTSSIAKNKQILNINNTYLVHLRDGLPKESFMRSGLFDYRNTKNALSIAKHSIHFSLSHVMPSHPDHQKSGDVLIIFPLNKLEEEFRNKILGTPEDLFIFTDKLPLHGAIFLIPQHLEIAFNNGLKKLLGPYTNYYVYSKTRNIDLAFIEYAKNHHVPYLESTISDGKYNIQNYAVTLENKKTFIQVQKLFEMFFNPENYTPEYSLHPLQHITLILETIDKEELINGFSNILTTQRLEKIYHNDGDTLLSQFNKLALEIYHLAKIKEDNWNMLALLLQHQKLPIDYAFSILLKQTSSTLIELHPYIDKIYLQSPELSLYEKLNRTGKVIDELLDNQSSSINALAKKIKENNIHAPGLLKAPYYGNIALFNLFNQTIVDLFSGKYIKSYESVVKYHAEKETLLQLQSYPQVSIKTTPPSLAGYTLKSIEEDQDCLFRAIITALDQDTHRHILIDTLGEQSEFWVDSLRTMIIAPIVSSHLIQAAAYENIIYHPNPWIHTEPALSFKTPDLTTASSIHMNFWATQESLMPIAQSLNLKVTIHHHDGEIASIPAHCDNTKQTEIHLFEHTNGLYDAYIKNENQPDTLAGTLVEDAL